MILSDLIGPDSISLQLQASDKAEVIEELSELLIKGCPRLCEAIDRSEVLDLLMERELLAATSIGNGIAVPHASSAKLESPCAAFGRSVPGIEFAALDGRPCHFFVALLSPISKPQLHLKTLSRIGRILIQEPVRRSLMTSSTPREAWDALKAGDQFIDMALKRQDSP